MTQYERTGCATVVLEVPERSEVRERRVMLKLLGASIAAEDVLSMQPNASVYVLALLREAIAEAEKLYEPAGEALAERIISKHLS